MKWIIYAGIGYYLYTKWRDNRNADKYRLEVPPISIPNPGGILTPEMVKGFLDEHFQITASLNPPGITISISLPGFGSVYEDFIAIPREDLIDLAARTLIHKKGLFRVTAEDGYIVIRIPVLYL